MKEYILSLDQGTTSSRAVLFNAKGEKVASVQKEYPQIFPGNGWVEHDPMDILESQLSSAREVIAKAGITAEDVAVRKTVQNPNLALKHLQNLMITAME